MKSSSTAGASADAGDDEDGPCDGAAVLSLLEKSPHNTNAEGITQQKLSAPAITSTQKIGDRCRAMGQPMRCARHYNLLWTRTELSYATISSGSSMPRSFCHILLIISRRCCS